MGSLFNSGMTTMWLAKCILMGSDRKRELQQSTVARSCGNHRPYTGWIYCFCFDNWTTCQTVFWVFMFISVDSCFPQPWSQTPLFGGKLLLMQRPCLVKYLKWLWRTLPSNWHSHYLSQSPGNTSKEGMERMKVDSDDVTLLRMMWLSHLWTHNRYSCLHWTTQYQAFQHVVVNGSECLWGQAPLWGRVGSWWLLEVRRESLTSLMLLLMSCPWSSG